MQSEKKILLVGGTVLRQHKEHGCFDDCEIVRELYGLSPLSLGERGRVQNVPKERLTLPLRYDCNHDFEGFLRKNPSDYIIVDLQKMVDTLMKVDGRYCTYMPKNKDPFYTEHKDDLVHVTDGKFPDFYQLFDSFTDMIKSRYSPDKIILLASFVPQRYAIGRQANRHFKRFAYNGWYNHFEERFVQRTGCAYYAKSRYYINEKKPGQKVRYAIFEDEYYTEARRDIDLIMQGAAYDPEPDYSLSIRRFVRYSDNLDRRFMTDFLPQEDDVNRFLMCCTGRVAGEMTDELVRLKAMSPEERADCGDDNELYRLYHAFVRSERQQATAEDTELLLSRDLRVPSVLAQIRAASGLRYPKQISYRNMAAYYHGVLSDDELPIPVDVIGCCVSRFIFNFDEEHFCVNKYAFHYMPVMTDKKVRYKQDLFDNNNWEHRMMKLQADRGLRDFLGSDHADWAVVDIFPLIELTAFKIKNKPIGSASGRFGPERGYEPVRIYEEYSEKFIKKELDKYIKLLRSVYGDNIILVASRRQIYKVNDDGSIARFTDPEANGPRNKAVAGYERYFVERCGCWYVNIIGDFISDEMAMASLSPVHYEDVCYEEEAAIIRRIISDRPGQKVFDTYSAPARLWRILCFREDGNDIEVLRDIFDEEGDDELLTMPTEELKNRISSAG